MAEEEGVYSLEEAESQGWQGGEQVFIESEESKSLVGQRTFDESAREVKRRAYFGTGRLVSERG